MTIEQLREAMHARPFKPFVTTLAEGRSVEVPHPEFLLVPPTASRTFVVATTTDAYRVIDLLLVASFDFLNGKLLENEGQGDASITR